jgi:hypothetical protein
MRDVLHACQTLVPSSHLMMCLIRYYFYKEVPW